MTATHGGDSTRPTAPALYLALELGWNSWTLAFAVELGQRRWLPTITARWLNTALCAIFLWPTPENW
jgi:hypothetical protein